MTDSELLSVFVRDRSPAAFESLVARYVDLVYATARRLVGDSHAAEDVTQAAFILLAKKAGVVQSRSVAGWLVNVTRLSAREAMRSKVTRQKHERRAGEMQARDGGNVDDSTAADISPLLDEALSSLSEIDRSVVVMRFLQGLGFAEVGRRTGLSEEAARKRVDRALVKLRHLLLKQDPSVSAGGLAVVLAAHQAGTAPASMLERLGDLSGNFHGGSAIAQKVMANMRWIQLKIAAVGIVTVSLAASATAIVVHHGSSAAPPTLVSAAVPATATHPAIVDLTTPESAVRSVFAAIDQHDTAALSRCLYTHNATEERLAKAWASATTASARLNRLMVQRFGDEALLDPQGTRFIDADPAPTADDLFAVELSGDEQTAMVGNDTLGWARVIKTGNQWKFAIVQAYGKTDQQAKATPIIEGQTSRIVALIADLESGKCSDLATARNRKVAGCTGGRTLLPRRAFTP